MNILLDAQEAMVQRAVAEVLAAECTPSLVREAERHYLGYSKELWGTISGLGWMALCLPQECGGQALPITYLGLVLEEVGRRIAPLPVYATMIPALILAKYGTAKQRRMLERVAIGDLMLSFAVAEKSGHWSTSSIELAGHRDGDYIVLSGTKYFVDQFTSSEQCLVTCRLNDGEKNEVSAILVDSDAPGISVESLVPMAKDSESVVTFDKVSVPARNIVGESGQGASVVSDIMDYAAIFLVPQMQGAARHAMELAVAYVNNREAFGQPIGAFQAIQHMAADMLNAVDGSQLLAREAIWRLSKDLPARVEVCQAKAFANEKCVMVCRCAQQMHGGLGFIAASDINLWYRRVASWSTRAGTSYEHRSNVAAALLDSEGHLRLGATLTLPAHIML
jgi:alkylation response protein AidB-like acyl-CoA dehydrogenase